MGVIQTVPKEYTAFSDSRHNHRSKCINTCYIDTLAQCSQTCTANISAMSLMAWLQHQNLRQIPCTPTASVSLQQPSVSVRLCCTVARVQSTKHNVIRCQQQLQHKSKEVHHRTVPWLRYVNVSSLMRVAGDVAAFNMYW